MASRRGVLGGILAAPFAARTVGAEMAKTYSPGLGPATQAVDYYGGNTLGAPSEGPDTRHLHSLLDALYQKRERRMALMTQPIDIDLYILKSPSPSWKATMQRMRDDADRTVEQKIRQQISDINDSFWNAAKRAIS